MINTTHSSHEEHAKLKELILYIANKLVEHPKFGATKLNKILFYSDFIAYAKLGKPITGEKYFKLDNGPVPKSLVQVREELETSNDIVYYVKETLRGAQKRIAPKRSADLSKFTPEEISIIDYVIELLRDKDAEEVRDISHYFMGWRIVKDREDIPYETVFISDPKNIVITDRHKEIARKLAG